MSKVYAGDTYRLGDMLFLETELGPIQVRITDISTTAGFSGMIFNKVTFVDISTGMYYTRIYTETMPPSLDAIKEPGFFD